MMPTIHIGIDDTDSKSGMCTTYIGALIADRLEGLGVVLSDLPFLIRLNPNWPLKTRGNCAVAMKVEALSFQLPIIKDLVLKTVGELAELQCETTNPGVAFYVGSTIPEKLKHFSKKVIQDIVTIEEAEEVAKGISAEIHKFKMGRGIIGALAAIGEPLQEDKTYELVAYRARDNWGTKRRVDDSSVFSMDRRTYPKTFDNIDPQTGEVRITPHTPCPILYGIRAESMQVAVEAHGMVKALEPIERLIVFKTNQATDEHILQKEIAQIKPLHSVMVQGTVSEKPRTISGGHVIFKIKDASGEIDCAAYEPTRRFRDVIKGLVVGDGLNAFAGAKRKSGLPLTINLEKIEVLQLTPVQRKVNPFCPKCGKTLKSEGKNKGFSCKRCKLRYPRQRAKFVLCPRALRSGLYEVPPRARRHLAKPSVRHPSWSP